MDGGESKIPIHTVVELCCRHFGMMERELVHMSPIKLHAFECELVHTGEKSARTHLAVIENKV